MQRRIHQTDRDGKPLHGAHRCLDVLLHEREKLFQRGDALRFGASSGAEDEKVVAGYPKDLLQMDLGAPLQTLVLPGELHFMEAEALVDFAGAPEEIIQDDE